METNKEQSSQSEKKQSKQKESFVASESFVTSLTSFPEDLKRKLKLLKGKLFIPERVLDDVLEAYSGWLTTAGVGAYSKDKLLGRLFGSTSQTLYYLPEGNTCEIGYLVVLPVDLQGSDQAYQGVVRSSSVSISAIDYLHPKDQSVSEIEGVEIRRPTNQSTSIVFQIKNDSYVASEPLVRKIVSAIRLSKKLSESYPQVHVSLRDALQPVRSILRASKKVHRSKPILIPEQFAVQPQQYIFYTFSHLVFVFQGTSIIDVYEHRGKGFATLLDQEAQYLITNKKIKSIDVFQLVTRDAWAIGCLKIAGKWFSVDKRGFRFLLEKIGESKWFRGKIDETYTLSQVLEKLVPALKNADWVDVSKLGREAALAEHKKPRFELKYTPWTFKTGKNYTIIEFIESGVKDSDAKRFHS